MPDSPDRQNVVVKILLSLAEQDDVRLAAALNRSSMSEYCRSLVLADAKRLAASINRPQSMNEPKSASKKSSRKP